MIDILFNSPTIWIVLTIGAYLAIAKIQGQVKSATIKPFVNPLLLAIVVVIVILLVFDIPYDTYNKGGQYIGLFVTPATVALAIKLERNFSYLKTYYKAILTGIVTGVVVHTVMIVLFGFLFNFDMQMVGTLYPKSITTAIAVGVSESMGGLVSLTVAIVVITGVVGNVFGETIFRIFGIKNPVAQGIALGNAAHAMGTSKAIEMGEVQGAMSGLAIVVTGIVVVALAPFVEPLLQLMF
ncbi:LrgB family protein [Aerococcaceae bacterium DSM 111022]|nr:LrgB family protein [Aerococcaceae bacterium DSM 111022]